MWWSTPIGRLAVYHLAMLAAMLIGAAVFYWQLRRLSVERSKILSSLPLAVALPVAMARLIDAAVYAPELFSGPLWRLLDVFSGGLSSHGAILGLTLLAAAIGLHYRRPISVVGDRLVPWALLGLAATRIADHLHGQGIGTPSKLPWATTFHDPISRHPTHIYELTLIVALGICASLLWRRLATSRPGVLSSVIMAVYFLGRLAFDGMREVAPFYESTSFTIGQALSAPFAVFFAILAVYRFRSAHSAPMSWPPSSPPIARHSANPRRVAIGLIVCIAASAVLGGLAQQIVTDPDLRLGFGFWQLDVWWRYAAVWSLPLLGMAFIGARLGSLLGEIKSKAARGAILGTLLLLALATVVFFMYRIGTPAAALAWLVLSPALLFRHGPRDLIVFLIAGVGATLVGQFIGPRFPCCFPERMIGPVVSIYFGLAAVFVFAIWERFQDNVRS